MHAKEQIFPHGVGVEECPHFSSRLLLIPVVSLNANSLFSCATCCFARKEYLEVPLWPELPSRQASDPNETVLGLHKFAAYVIPHRKGPAPLAFVNEL